MKESIKTKLVYNLRSGLYKKTKGKLRSVKTKKDGTESYTYCALGVLVDMYINSNENCCWTPTGVQINGIQYKNDILPEPVRIWAEMDSTSGRYKDYSSSISEKNDKGVSFKEIADDIETGLVE